MTQALVEESRWVLRVCVETECTGFGRWRVFWKATVLPRSRERVGTIDGPNIGHWKRPREFQRRKRKSDVPVCADDRHDRVLLDDVHESARDGGGGVLLRDAAVGARVGLGLPSCVWAALRGAQSTRVENSRVGSLTESVVDESRGCSRVVCDLESLLESRVFNRAVESAFALSIVFPNLGDCGNETEILRVSQN